MRVNRRELTLWSFLMSSAHGAGLIVAPVLIGVGSAARRTTEDHTISADASVTSLMADGVGLMLHVGAMIAGDGRWWRCSSTTSSASRCCARRG